MRFFLPFILLLTFVGCKNKKDETKPPLPEDIFDTYHTSVVLIKNEYVYKLELADYDSAYYFTDIEDGETIYLYNNYDSAYQHRKTIYGTGFFIDKDGIIATNRHVVEGTFQLWNIEEYIKEDYGKMVIEFENYIKKIEDSISRAEDILAREDDADLSSAVAQYKIRKQFVEDILHSVKIVSESELTVSVISKISIASDDNYNADRVLIPCNKLKVYDNYEIDLALIQTASHKLPSGVTRFIPLDYNNDNPFYTKKDSIVYKPLKINTKLYMIGYNNAAGMGMTSKGLKPQLTQGTVSQESDEQRVLYSIPSLSGSSGSPILDEWGNLVAINYAGIQQSQSFNYGVLATHLRALYSSDSVQLK